MKLWMRSVCSVMMLVAFGLSVGCKTTSPAQEMQKKDWDEYRARYAALSVNRQLQIPEGSLQERVRYSANMAELDALFEQAIQALENRAYRQAVGLLNELETRQGEDPSFAEQKRLGYLVTSEAYYLLADRLFDQVKRGEERVEVAETYLDRSRQYETLYKSSQAEAPSEETTPSET